MGRLVTRLFIAFMVLAGVLAIGAVILALHRPALPPLPQPNGYDDFVKAGQMLTGAFSDYNRMKVDELRAVVSTNAEALKLARTGLSRECRVPSLGSSTNALQEHSARLARIKCLGQAFAAESRLAELENRPDAAAASCLDAIRLGERSARGGILIDRLVGMAAQRIGVARLDAVKAALDAKQCRQAALVLESLQAGSEPVEAVLERDRAWARRVYGLQWYIFRIVSWRSARRNERGLVARMRGQQTQTRLLMVQLSARAFELENGRPPQSFADLVPGYLRAVPQDPLTGTNLVFRPRVLSSDQRQ